MAIILEGALSVSVSSSTRSNTTNKVFLSMPLCDPQFLVIWDSFYELAKRKWTKKFFTNSTIMSIRLMF